MRKIKTKFAVMFITLLFLLSTLDQAMAFATAYNNETIDEVEDFSSYLNYKIDSEGNRYALYLVGQNVPLEPAGDLFNGTHTLWFATLDVGKFEENASIDISKSSVTKTQVTSKKVLPFNYNFQIDSEGNVHLVFISNYTLYYAVRTPDNIWTEVALNDNVDWFAYQPDIQLGENDEPRIMYIASYKSGASDYFGTQVNSAFRAVHYMLYNETGWFLYDISMNNKPGAQNAPFKYLVYNPGFIVSEGQVYAAYNVDSSLGQFSGMEFVRFSEYPDEEENTQGFDELKFPKLYQASVRATQFRRPRLMIIENDLIMLVGTWTTGGGIIAYLANNSATPVLSVSGSAADQWDVFQIENKRRSLQIEGFTGIVDQNTGTVIATYSAYHLFNEAEGQFNYDVFQLTFRPTFGEIGEVLYSRVTDSNNVYHTYPNLAFTPEGSIEVAFIRHKNGGTTRDLMVGTSATAFTYEEGGEWGMLLAILTVGGLFGGWFVFMNKFVAVPKEEEEILPHMVNLKDSITKD